MITPILQGQAISQPVPQTFENAMFLEPQSSTPHSEYLGSVPGILARDLMKNPAYSAEARPLASPNDQPIAPDAQLPSPSIKAEPSETGRRSTASGEATEFQNLLCELSFNLTAFSEGGHHSSGSRTLDVVCHRMLGVACGF